MMTWTGEAVLKDIHRRLGKGLDKCAKTLATEVQKQTPFRTGFLRANTTVFSVDKEALKAVVKCGARYSGFVHEGYAPNGHRPANRFFDPRGIIYALPKMADDLRGEF